MDSAKDSAQVRNVAMDKMRHGMNCAEAVCTTIMETRMQPQGPDGQAMPFAAAMTGRAATAFAGGLGRSKEEMCGALAGGVLALGCLFGRETPGSDYAYVADLAAEFRLRFRALTGATRCLDVLAALGPQEHWEACIRLAGDTAGALHDLLVEQA